MGLNFMKKRINKNDYIIIALAVLLTVSYYSIKYIRIFEKDTYYEEKVKASIIMNEAILTIKEERIKKGIPIDKTIDINETGIIGYEYSAMTTTLGSPEAKRTSINPSFAAVVLHMMKELGLKKGDYAAINLSGSFPGLNIAVLSAAQTLGLNPVVMSSAGASTYGANIPEFNYLHMEEILYNKKILSAKSIKNSLGGDRDIGFDMEEDIRSLLLKQFDQYGRSVLYESDLDKNISKRYEIYQEISKNKIKCFINVGGNLASIGNEEDWSNAGSGIILPGVNRLTVKSGLIGKFLSDGVPVINLLNIKRIAVDCDIPIDPFPMPQIGEDGIFYKYTYPRLFSWLLILLTTLTIIYYGRKVRTSYDR